jgi:hypothetical protein
MLTPLCGGQAVTSGKPHSADQKLGVCNPKVHQRVHKSIPLDIDLSQVNSTQNTIL